MIVIVDKTFLTRSEEEKEQDVCDIISILEHGHYIEMNPLVKATVTEIVENSLSKPQKALYQEATEYLSPTRTMKRYLQTLKFYDFTLEQRKLLFLTSSELLIDANSTSKCKITKCFCKSTPLVLRNSIFFLVSH